MKVSAALELLLQLTTAGAKLSALITQARAEGREELTQAELQTLVTENDAATAALAAEIAKAKGEGR